MLGDAAWYAFLSDIFATLVAIGVGMAFFIRKVLKPDRFRGSHMQEADRILFAILAIVVTLLLWNASRIALGPDRPGPRPVSDLLSACSPAAGGTEVAERILVWSHLLVILGFLVFLPGSKHLHIATARPTCGSRRTSDRPPRAEPDRPRGGRGGHPLRRRDPEGPVAKQMLDLFSCTECGRCQEACPAWATGKPLSPKLLIMDLRTAWSPRPRARSSSSRSFRTP